MELRYRKLLGETANIRDTTVRVEEVSALATPDRAAMHATVVRVASATLHRFFIGRPYSGLTP